MYAQTLVFIAATLLLLSASRAALMAWQRPRVQASGRPAAIVLGGLRIDAHMIAVIAILPLTLAPWVGQSALAQAINGIWLLIGWLAIVLLELSTPQFIDEYDTRPNRLYVVYLTNPREVFTMLWRGYRSTVLAVVVVTGLMAWAGYAMFWQPLWPSGPQPLWLRGLQTLAALAGGILAIRGTLKHRPINPSTVAFCGDAMVNALPLNSLYSVLYAVYSMKNQRSSSDAYGSMPEDEMQRIVRQSAGLPDPANAAIPTLHPQASASRLARPRNLVMIVEESLGAQFVGHLGGRGLTPCLDKLMQEGWAFTNAYATGTRSVRGLEALVAGFPPSLSEAVLRLPDAQSNFFTLAQFLKRQGYRTCFVYGGEAHFDNMKSFFLGNGFDELYDLKTFEDPAFVGTWGASDEDMFARVHRILEDSAEQPCFVLAFSVSNHSPWEYPQGRIEPVGEPASVENTVRYADWALGEFFGRAKQASYWNESVFLVAADHDARVGGAAHIPLKHFQIPALILGAGVPVRQDERLVSQIDMPVTLLSLLGVHGQHPMIGQDLTDPRAGGRAMMQYGDSYGYLRDDILTVLEPRKPASQFRYVRPDRYERMEPDAGLARVALAHVLWVERTYRDRGYGLPAVRDGAVPRRRAAMPTVAP
ncbi:membrane-associated sulfatase [Bordetella ansorpii]|uniref:Membrane-associated sulfatase n=1 Tax=Bordetella ansorpii TaxID=288768 RepID=A0A157P4B4_9BORD|nr:LTA synthase family protein [Bordetella ansorpii]SAI28348.1 membrane-associated sulfatase [Bordetella ansorpii]